MKTLIIATDFSDNAWKAVCYGANTYHTIPCHYVIVHTYYVPSVIVEVDVPSIISEMSKEINDRMTIFKSNFEELEHHNDTTFEYIDRYGETSSILLEIAKNSFSDLIIMGTRGETNDENIIFGSTAMDLISNAPIPVIAVPENAQLEPLKQIMLATDYENITNLSTLLAVKEIAEIQESEIFVVNIKENEKSTISEEKGMEGLVLHNFFGDIPHEYFDRVEDDIETGLINFAEQKQVDLIVLVNRERKFWEQLFHKSISEKMGRYSTVPLMVLRD